MYCQYAGCECIVCEQVSGACADCKLRTDAYLTSLLKQIELCELYFQANALPKDDLEKLQRIYAEVKQMKEEYLENKQEEK